MLPNAPTSRSAIGYMFVAAGPARPAWQDIVKPAQAAVAHGLVLGTVR